MCCVPRSACLVPAPFLLIDTFSWKHLQNFVSSHQCFIRPRPARHVVIKSWIRLEAQQLPQWVAQNALWHVSRNAPSPPLFVVGVSCHKKQISCARVAYFPFDFQWFSCSLACFPLLTLAAWPGISAILLRRVVDIYAKHIDSSATRGQMYVCECLCVCLFGMQRRLLDAIDCTLPPTQGQGEYFVIRCDWILVQNSIQFGGFPHPPWQCSPPWLLASLMYELHNQARHVGEKESSGPSARICKSIFL